MSKYFPAPPAWAAALHDTLNPQLVHTGRLVDWSRPSLWAFVAMTAFNPIFWNTVARNGKWSGRTYLGDYFGILMSHRVTSFPFNVLSDPMYVGSALSHLGTALWYQSPAGVALSAWVWIVYSVALNPFTDKIYSASASSKREEPTPTSSAVPPATPSRRSGRLAARKSVSASDVDSDADVKPATTPGASLARRRCGMISPRRAPGEAPGAGAGSRARTRIRRSVRGDQRG
ncbi:hypothetical protein IAU60_003185 [Kwoniella sp. DSM 27419]